MVPLFTRSHQDQVELRRDVVGVRLPGRRRPEAGAHAAAHGDVGVEGVAAGELAVERGAEVGEVLEAGGAAQRPVGAPARLRVDVAGEVAAAPVAFRDRAEAGEAVGRRAEALVGEGAVDPGLGLSDADRELLVAPLQAARQVDRAAERVADAQVDVDLLLLVQAGVELGGRVGTQRGVHGVVDEELHLVGAEARARAPGQALVGLAPDAGHGRVVAHVAAELGSEAAREHLLVREAVGVGEHAGQGRRVRHGCSMMRTTGQFDEPSSTPSRASRTSPISSVSPPSLLKTPPRVLGLR